MTMDDQIQAMNNNYLDLNTLLQDFIEGDNDDDLLTNILMESRYYDVDNLITLCKSLSGDQVKVMHLNIQSLPAKFDKLLSILTDLEESGIYLDAIRLCETWLHQGNIDIYSISGYNLVYKNRLNTKGGGVAIYLRSSIDYKLREDLSIFNEGKFESVFIEATVRGVENYNGRNL